MDPVEELRRLDGNAGDCGPIRADLTVAARPGGAAVVLDRTRDVLRAVLAQAGPPWPAVEDWRLILPEWFVASCAPEQSAEEAELWLHRWRGLPPEGRARATHERGWALSDWLYWLEPQEREWHWCEGFIQDPDHLRVGVQVTGWPAPLGALEWLLRTAGAVEVVCRPPDEA